jgi:hypothetical protein
LASATTTATSHWLSPQEMKSEPLSKGQIAWRTFNPRVELRPVNRVEIFCDYMDDFNPGVELSSGLKILSCNRAFDFDRVLYYRQG